MKICIFNCFLRPFESTKKSLLSLLSLLKICHFLEINDHSTYYIFLYNKYVESVYFTQQTQQMKIGIYTASVEILGNQNRNEISSTLKQKFKENHKRNGDFWCGIKIFDEKELPEINFAHFSHA